MSNYAGETDLSPETIYTIYTKQTMPVNIFVALTKQLNTFHQPLFIYLFIFLTFQICYRYTYVEYNSI